MDMGHGSNLLDALDPDGQVATGNQAPIRLAEFFQRAARYSPSMPSGRPVRPGEPIFVFDAAPESFLTTLIWVLQHDAVAVPCDPAMGTATLHRALSVATPGLAVVGRHATPSVREVLYQAGIEVTKAPSPASRPAAPPVGLTPQRGGADPALVLFTSGSTGAPKGVMLTHRNVRHSLSAILDYLPVRQYPHTGVVLPLHYSYTLIGQLLVTLAAGGCTRFFSHLRFPTEMVSQMQASGVQGLSSVPTSLRLLCDVVAEDDPPWTTIGYVGSAGARLPAEMHDVLRQTFPRARMFNQYGCTEAAPRVSFIEDMDPAFAKGGVGRPISGLQLTVLDDDGSAVPPGRVGHLAMRGPNVSPGYYNDPTATEASRRGSFFLNGDRGYLDPKGCLYLVGRDDRLVNCGGERISLDEIEEVLRQHPSVKDAAVVGREHPIWGTQPVALLVGDATLRSQLECDLRDALSAAKRPAQLKFVDRLPRSSTGKLQKQELLRILES